MTVDAMMRLSSIIKDSGGRYIASNKFVGMLTLDVKNAINSTSWDVILQRLEKTKTTKYLRNILGEYLRDREITFEKHVGTTTRNDISCEVPQGSVFGPELWNLLYDDFFKIRLPEDTEPITFADNVTIITTAQVLFLLEERLGEALKYVVS